jgi:hypothetical protein
MPPIWLHGELAIDPTLPRIQLLQFLYALSEACGYLTTRLTPSLYLIDMTYDAYLFTFEQDSLVRVEQACPQPHAKLPSNTTLTTLDRDLSLATTDNGQRWLLRNYASRALTDIVAPLILRWSRPTPA